MHNDLVKIWETHQRMEKQLAQSEAQSNKGSSDYLHQYAHAHRGYLLNKFEEFKVAFDKEKIEELIEFLLTEEPKNKKGLQIRQVLQTLKSYCDFVESIPVKNKKKR